MAYIDSDGNTVPETAAEIRAELERIDAREQDIRANASRLGDDETEWQLAHCLMMRRHWKNCLARLKVA